MFVDVKVKIGWAALKKAWEKDPKSVLELNRSVPIAQVLATWIRDRVTKRGDLAGQPRQRWAVKGRRRVARPLNLAQQEGYRIEGVFTTRDGKRMAWVSGQDVKEIDHGGTYVNTGGMWRGLTVGFAPGRGAKLYFGGKSKATRGKDTISNALKASTVLQDMPESSVRRKNRINLLWIRQEERDAVAAAYCQMMADAGKALLGGAVQAMVFCPKGNGALFSRVVAALKPTVPTA